MASESDVLRVVLLGKTGVGKSSTGNTLCQRQDAFKVVKGLNSGTDKCQWDWAVVDNIKLEVTDTPGLSDTHQSQAEVLKEVGKSIAVSGPGPHVILMVIKLDRFTDAEFMVYDALKKIFGPEIKKHMIIVFTAIDDFADTIQEQKKVLSQQLTNAPSKLKEVLEDANNRFIGISNKANAIEENLHASDLITMMMDLKRQRRGTFFRNDISDRVDKLVQSLVDSGITESNKSRAEATSEIKKAIVDEAVSGSFFDNLAECLLVVGSIGIGAIVLSRTCALM